MHEWTDGAEEELGRYSKRVRGGLESTGADPDEVLEDLRRHIDEEVAASGDVVVTRDCVARLVQRMGVPGLPQGALPEPSAPLRNGASGDEVPRIGSGATALVSFFGIALPAITLGLELVSGICASVFFDPIPSVFHALLIACVPATYAWLLVDLRRARVGRVAVQGWMSALAVAISLYYALVFLPFTPFACIGVIYFGLGLIPLSPLLALIVGIYLRTKLRRRLAAAGLQLRPKVWVAVVLVLLGFFLLELPKTTTMVGIRMAASGQQATRSRGLGLLRSMGSRKQLLRACYGVRKPVTDLVGFVLGMFSDPVPAKDVQTVFYRVTGTPYNALEPPDLRGVRGGALINAWEFDFAQGGDEVAARVRDLSLAASRIDAAVDADAGTAYTEWTFEFLNDAQRQHEARCEIALPPGSVVSRLTLWIDGEEREAAFGPRKKVKEAYKRVVQRRRDPVLVTTSGPDQVLAQCFPVPPGGGTMKVRLGITAPLVPETEGRALLRMPFFLERNFAIPADVTHAVWVEGRRALEPVVAAAGLKAESTGGDGMALRGTVSDDLLSGTIAIRCARDPQVRDVWARDERSEGEGIIQQSLAPAAAWAPERLVIVVDGSRRMGPHAGAVCAVIEKLPEGLSFAVLMASDGVGEVCSPGPSTPAARAAAAGAIKRHRFAGGADNVPALLSAWETAGVGGAILWLHATQPVEMQGTGRLVQRWERRPAGPLLFDMQFGPGPNLVAKGLDGLAAVRGVPSFGDAEADLGRLVGGWGGAGGLEFLRRRLPDAVTPEGRQADLHVARLWASEEVRRLGSRRGDAATAAAVQLACAYQLVTPVTGAVVLETEQQYKEAGLKPVDAAAAPAVVPEPASIALFAIGLAVLLIAAARRRLRAQTHSS